MCVLSVVGGGWWWWRYACLGAKRIDGAHVHGRVRKCVCACVGTGVVVMVVVGLHEAAAVLGYAHLLIHGGLGRRVEHLLHAIAGQRAALHVCSCLALGGHALSPLVCHRLQLGQRELADSVLPNQP